MNIVSLTQRNESEVINEAVSILKKGGSVVYPTDTVYGLGVNPFDDFAVGRLFRIKKRLRDKPIALIVKSIAMAKKLAYIDTRKEKVLRSVWPGAVSIILRKRDIISPIISAGTNTVSLRMPKNDFCINLLKAFNGPITSTSANISGENHTNDASEFRNRFSREIYRPDLVIDAGVLDKTMPSTVLDLTKPVPKITRIGPVSPKDLTRILKL
ncbi:MAG: L-threonylcarbamoyladenylate synthase [Candidatus Spechtbacterales bacterium]